MTRAQRETIAIWAICAIFFASGCIFGLSMFLAHREDFPGAAVAILAAWAVCVLALPALAWFQIWIWRAK